MTELEDALAYGDKYLSSFQHKQIDLRQVGKKISKLPVRYWKDNSR